MKQVLLLIIIISTTFSMVGQDLPNTSFEDNGTRDIEVFEYDFSTNSFNGTTCTIDGDGAGTTSTFNGTGRPFDWATSDDVFGAANPAFNFIDSDANSGSSAMRLTTGGNFGVGILGIFLPETGFFDALPVSFPFTEIPVSIDGFYKHSSGASVTFPAGTCVEGGPLTEPTTFDGGFLVYAQFFKDDVLVASTRTIFPDVADYTAFSAPITVEAGMEDEIPNNLLLLIANSPYVIAPNPIIIPDSVSFVDDVNFEYEPLSVNSFDSVKFALHPNPALNSILLSNLKVGESIAIYDLHGRLVLEALATKQNLNLELSQLSSGMYFVNHSGTVKKLIKR